MGWQVNPPPLSAMRSLTALPLSGVKVFTDEEGLVFLVLAGKPTDADWPAVCDSAAVALSETARIGLENGAFTLDDLIHRRGWSFFALPVGTSYGGGQQVRLRPPYVDTLLNVIFQAPGNLVHPEPRAKLARSLLKNEDIRRIAGFQSRTCGCLYSVPRATSGLISI